MKNTAGIIAMSALLGSVHEQRQQPERAKTTPRDHNKHLDAAQAKRERKLARNRRIEALEQ